MEKLSFWIKLVFLFGLTFICIKAEHICLQCDGSVLPTTCTTVRKCGSHEICFVEQYVNQFGSIRYNLGCRDEQHCFASAFGKRSQELISSSDTHVEAQRLIPIDIGLDSSLDEFDAIPVVCSECCHGDLCNNNGCGMPGYVPLSMRGPVCYSCSVQAQRNDCDQIAVCARDMVCMLEKKLSPIGNVELYGTRCEYNTTCQESRDGSHGGQCGTQCCNNDLCNNDNVRCDATPQPTTPSNLSPTSDTPLTYPPGVLTTASLDTPLTYPPGVVTTASLHTTTPVTESPSSATSNTTNLPALTSTVSRVCLSNPCAFGKCVDSGSKFSCVCDHGYTGERCDSSVDSCGSSPCLFGLCVNIATSPFYHCVCVPGTFGMHCEQGNIMGYTTKTTAGTTPNTLSHCLSNPCVHGTCKDNSTGFTCNCRTGYTGKTCSSSPCQPNPCDNGGQCAVDAVTPLYSCQCIAGYTGQNCSDKVTTTSTMPTTPEHNFISPHTQSVGWHRQITGLAASVLHPGLFYTLSWHHHNWILYTIDVDGRIVSAIDIGDRFNDVEDLSIAPCGYIKELCLYIADTGSDHPANILYRIPESELHSGQSIDLHSHQIALTFQNIYTSHSAMMIDRNGTIFALTPTGHCVILGSITSAQDVHMLKQQPTTSIDGDVLCADISPNGKEILIKTTTGLFYWYVRPGEDVISALHRPGTPVPDVSHKDSVSWDANGHNYYIISDGTGAPLYEFRRS